MDSGGYEWIKMEKVRTVIVKKKKKKKYDTE